ncbi:TolC family protein [Sphingobacterium chungjuense]|uniref:TolC family protein n=1 Tax=Sphingobacterium chungjuense TaxID=2675553 RepID=UPI0014091BC5|nr:TolC family protein [Sphingobacterium chungjuense]
MKTLYIMLLSGILFSQVGQAQTFSLEELEAAFLQNNYMLIASRFQVNQADAEIVQEKLWDNPTLSISEVNLWSNRTSEQFARLFGNYGRTQQFAIDLEQLIETAGKRKKRVAIRSLEKNNAVFEYEEVMRELRKDLRQAYNELYVISNDLGKLQESVTVFANLSETFKRQAASQNISKADWLRVQSELVTMEKEQVDLQAELIEAIGVIQALTSMPDLSIQQLSFADMSQRINRSVPLDTRAMAFENNLGIKKQQNQLLIADKELELELANRKPDLTVGINYDRGGNIMQDFFGLGVSMDLPIFNRNKGNIKVAQYQIEEQRANRSAIEIALDTRLTSLTAQLVQYRQTLDRWSALDVGAESKMLENYHKNMLSKQITLLEFIDFTQAWRASYQSMLEIQKNYLNTYEELQFVVGNDF